MHNRAGMQVCHATRDTERNRKAQLPSDLAPYLQQVIHGPEWHVLERQAQIGRIVAVEANRSENVRMLERPEPIGLVSRSFVRSLDPAISLSRVRTSLT